MWPENWNAVLTFSRGLTQWTVGFSGPVGLRYEAMEALMRLYRIPVAERADCLDRIRVMEAEALGVFAERRER